MDPRPLGTTPPGSRAANAQPADAQPPGPAELVDRACAALSRRDVEATLACFAPDCVLDVDGFGLGGTAGARRWLEAVCGAFPDLAAQALDTSADEEVATFTLVLSGTQTGDLASPFGTVPAAGRGVVVRETVTLRAGGGAIVELFTTLDRLGFVAQLGLLDHRLGSGGG